MSLDITLSVETCPHCGAADTVFDGNITHNLTSMAGACRLDICNLYDVIWQPHTIFNEPVKAWILIGPLESGIIFMKNHPSTLSQYNASNGWGTYDEFLSFVSEYLEACRKWPHATVNTHR